MINILKFGAPWCVPCGNLAVELKKIDFSSMNTSLDEFNLDDDDDMIVASQYRIRSVPTLVFIDDSGNELHRHVGSATASQITEIIDGLNDSLNVG